ncbi:hypothetical protein JO965_23230 [Microvirga sp. VF16]|nr:hypothetical protein JO965_23230 [Microvirga sp. VF16]
MLSNRRNTRAAYRFLRRALKLMSDYPPSSITTNRLAFVHRVPFGRVTPPVPSPAAVVPSGRT